TLRHRVDVLSERRVPSAGDVTGDLVDRLLLRSVTLRRAGVEDRSAVLKELFDVLRDRDAVVRPRLREEPRAVPLDRRALDPVAGPRRPTAVPNQGAVAGDAEPPPEPRGVGGARVVVRAGA